MTASLRSRRVAARPAHRRRSPRLLDPSSLHAEIRAGNFHPSLLGRAIKLEQAWSGLSRMDDERYLQAKCVIAEVFDYFGEYDRAKRLLESDGVETERLVGSLSDSTAPLERKLWKRRVWLLINYAHTLYRSGEYQQCLKLLGESERTLDALNGGETGSPGTRARLHYSLGQVFRQLNHLDKSEKAFVSAMKYSEDRLRSHLDDPATASSMDAETKLANWTIGKCVALGLGWIRYTQGQLSNAEPLVIAGRAFLRGTNDVIHRTYADLLYGTILRAQAGVDNDKLARAVRVLEAAHFTFGKWGHPIYRARAAFELALAFLHQRDFSRATQHMLEVRATAAARNDKRWLCNASIVESRILREQGQTRPALEIATRTARDAQFASETLCYIDALIACGEALLAGAAGKEVTRDSPELAEARRYFDEAAHLAGNNAKVKAICHVHRARMFSLAGDAARAHAAMRNYETLKREVESGFVHHLARRLYDDLESGDFVINTTSAQTLQYEFWRQRLQGFLLEQARRRSPNLSNVAEQLGVSRQTLYTWLAAARADQKESE